MSTPAETRAIRALRLMNCRHGFTRTSRCVAENLWPKCERCAALHLTPGQEELDATQAQPWLHPDSEAGKRHLERMAEATASLNARRR
jgi:hypothetical protein